MEYEVSVGHGSCLPAAVFVLPAGRSHALQIVNHMLTAGGLAEIDAPRANSRPRRAGISHKMMIRSFISHSQNIKPLQCSVFDSHYLDLS